MTSSKQRTNKTLTKEREENIMNPVLIDILVEIGKLVVAAIGEAVKENE